MPETPTSELLERHREIARAIENLLTKEFNLNNIIVSPSNASFPRKIDIRIDFAREVNTQLTDTGIDFLLTAINNKYYEAVTEEDQASFTRAMKKLRTLEAA